MNLQICHNALEELAPWVGLDVENVKSIEYSTNRNKAKPLNCSHLHTIYILAICLSAATSIQLDMLNRRIIYRIAGTHIQLPQHRKRVFWLNTVFQGVINNFPNYYSYWTSSLLLLYLLFRSYNVPGIIPGGPHTLHPHTHSIFSIV